MGGKPGSKKLKKRLKEDEVKEVERSQVESALRECEERFRSLYARSPLGYQSLDESGHINEINQAWVDILGYPKEEVIGRPFGDFLHPDWQEYCKENFSRFLAIGDILGVELEMVRKDGEVITVFFNGKILRDNKGNFKQMPCVLLDITDRKQAEEDTEQLRDELQAARAEIETLQRLLPVCSECKTYWHDKEFNHRVEAYVRQHPGIELGTGRCPACKR